MGGIQHKIYLYADDVLLYVLEPETSVSGLVDVITLFGCFSGYLTILSVYPFIYSLFSPPEGRSFHCTGQMHVL